MNLGRGYENSGIGKNNKNMLLVKIFLIKQRCKTKTATLQGLIFVQSDLSLVVFHFQDQSIQ